MLEILAAAEPDAAAAGRRLRHDPRARWRASAAASPASPTSADGGRGDRRAPRRRSRPTSQRCRASCASCARRWSASARSPTRPRRCSPTSARGAGHQPLIRELGPFSEAGMPALESLGDGGEVGIPALQRRRCRSSRDLRALRASSSGRSPTTSPRCSPRCRRPAASSALMDYIFFQVRDQRLRLLRPLPARRPDRQPVLDLRDRPRRPGCTAKFPAATATTPRVGRARRAAPTPTLAATRRGARAARWPATRRDGDAAARADRRARADADAATAARDADADATPAPSAAPSRRPPPRRADAERHAGAGRPGRRPARLPVREDDAMRPLAGASIAGNPVLIGAATMLVVIVAVFLAYNANSGLPFVPTYSSRPRCPARPTWCAATRCASAARASARSTTITPQTPRGRHERRRARAQARHDRRAAAQGLDGPHPPEVAARPQVRRDHARRARATGFGAGDTIPVTAATPAPGRVRRAHRTRSTSRRARRCGRTSTGFGTALAGRGESLNTAIGALPPAAARPPAGRAQPVGPATRA